MCDRHANPDALLAELAASQHGVVSVGQLRDIGLDKHRVRHRVRTGRLHPLHRGVYAVGHANPSRLGRWLAATLAIGKGAVLSHHSAAALWKLLPAKRVYPVEVSVPGDGGREPRRDIRLHRLVSLDAQAVTRRHGIPVTTPARTIADLHRVTTPEEVRRALRQAEALGHRVTSADGNSGGTEKTRSELEHLFLELCIRERFPRPGVNVRIGSWIVDFVWPDRRLIVETDGYQYHRGRVAFEEDRVRDLGLRSLGFEVIRLSYEQVVRRPRQTADHLRRILYGSRAPASRRS